VFIVKKEIFKITGMACPACAKGIEKILSIVPGVSKATACLDAGELELNFDERKLSPLIIKEIVNGIVQDVLEETRKMSVSIPLSGLSCPECAARIEEKLEGREGVTSVSVNCTPGRVSVTYDPRRIDISQIKNAIGDPHCAEKNDRRLKIEGEYACGCCGN
jgi:Cu+-exporting ATPase